MAGDEKEERHYCNVTFLTVGDPGPDGLPIQSLLRCTRCLETYYCGKEQQRKHWKIHKKVCKPRSAEVEESVYSNYSMNQVVMEFSSLFDFSSRNRDVILQNSVGRVLLFLLRRLQSMCQNTANYQPTEEDESSMSRVLCPALMKLQVVRNEIIDLLWAVPGMATYLLNLELISDPMHQRKSENRPPTAEELEFQGFDPAFQVHKHFSAAVSYFLLASIRKSQEG